MLTRWKTAGWESTRLKALGARFWVDAPSGFFTLPWSCCKAFEFGPPTHRLRFRDADGSKMQPPHECQHYVIEGASFGSISGVFKRLWTPAVAAPERVSVDEA